MEEKNKDVNATIFTYSFGNSITEETISTIACIGNGIWTPIYDEDEIKVDEILSTFNTFVTTGLYRQEPVWTMYHNDILGKGTVIEVVYPILETN